LTTTRSEERSHSMRARRQLERVGLSASSIERFLHAAVKTLLGEAGERAGLDRLLKTNTVKHRTLSLYNQGCYWYTAIPNMREERLAQLMTAYGEVLREHAVTREILGTIWWSRPQPAVHDA